MHGQDWVKEMGEANAVRLGNQAKETSIAIKAPRSALPNNLEARFILAEEKLIGNFSASGFIG
jgi:hypothetical protein